MQHQLSPLGMLQQSVCGQLSAIILHSERQHGKHLLLFLKILHLLDLTLETVGYSHGMNREVRDAAMTLQFLLPLELLQILAALVISIQLGPNIKQF